MTRITDDEAAKIIRQAMRNDDGCYCCGSDNGGCGCRSHASCNTSRMFRGYRPSPPDEYERKGITNAGRSPDYEGCIFSDGTVAIRWLTQFRSTSIWDSLETFMQIHGHPEYGTSIIFQGEEGW